MQEYPPTETRARVQVPNCSPGGQLEYHCSPVFNTQNYQRAALLERPLGAIGSCSGFLSRAAFRDNTRALGENRNDTSHP